MKKHFKIPLILSTHLIFAGLFFYGFSYAQELISEPIEEPALVEEEFIADDPYSPEGELDTGGTGDTLVPLSHLGSSGDVSCIYNYKNWKSSTKMNTKAKWNLYFLINRQYTADYALTNYENERFIDLNGDGLVDYLYGHRSHNVNGIDYRHEGCVYLNTGAGFKKEYQCVIRIGKGNVTTYHGDCAG